MGARQLHQHTAELTSDICERDMDLDGSGTSPRLPRRLFGQQDRCGSHASVSRIWEESGSEMRGSCCEWKVAAQLQGLPGIVWNTILPWMATPAIQFPRYHNWCKMFHTMPSQHLFLQCSSCGRFSGCKYSSNFTEKNIDCCCMARKARVESHTENCIYRV